MEGGEKKREQAGVEDEYDPMSADFMDDVGLGVDHMTLSGGSVFKEANPKDVPCKYHDGFSGTCWKGSSCVYGHERYTGSRFANEFPELGFAANIRRKATPVTYLPFKPTLNNEREIVCQVTGIESPGEFYIRPTADGATCRCMKVDEVLRSKTKGLRKVVADDGDGMDNYFFGFSSLEIPDCLGVDTHVPIYVPVTEEEKLNCYLNTAFNYKKHQVSTYFPGVELVAARVNNKWNRAVVQFYLGNKGNFYEASPMRVQLLDTGEKVTLTAKDVCCLPPQFCTTHAAAFHCAIFRVTPIWFTWAKNATKIFKDLVEGKTIRVIVKDDAAELMGDVSTFEPRPYHVKILIDKENNGVLTDVAEELIDSGYGIEWCLMPYRPYAAKATNTKILEFLYQPVPEKLPPRALEVENKRLLWDIYDKKKSGDKDDESIRCWEYEELDSRYIKSFYIIDSVDKKRQNREKEIVLQSIESGLIYVDQETKDEKKSRICNWVEETLKWVQKEPFEKILSESVDENLKEIVQTD